MIDEFFDKLHDAEAKFTLEEIMEYVDTEPMIIIPDTVIWKPNVFMLERLRGLCISHNIPYEEDIGAGVIKTKLGDHPMIPMTKWEEADD
jgi:hypothetical protein